MPSEKPDIQRDYERAARYVETRLEKVQAASALPSLVVDPRTGELIDVLAYTSRARGRLDQAKRAIEAKVSSAARYHYGQARRLASRIYGVAKALGYIPMDDNPLT